MDAHLHKKGIISLFCRLFNVHMMCGEVRKDLKKQERKKLRKEKHKSNENLTRKLKVCCSIQLAWLTD